MSADVFVKRGSDHGPDFFRHEAAGLAWLAAAPGGPRVVEVVGVDDDEIYAAPVGNGGVHGGGLLPPRTGSRPRIVLSASRPPAFARAVAGAVDGDLVPLGSAGAKAAAVVRGEADAYVHAGGQYDWDSAAPVAVAQAKGLWCSRIDGSPLVYNQDDTYLPDLVICLPELRDAIIEVTSSEPTPTSESR